MVSSFSVVREAVVAVEVLFFCVGICSGDAILAKAAPAVFALVEVYGRANDDVPATGTSVLLWKYAHDGDAGMLYVLYGFPVS